MNPAPYLLVEVMDKEPALVSLWIAAVICSAAGFLLIRYRPWLVIISLAAAAWLALGILPEIYDPFVGPAIRKEAGLSYVIQAHLASGLPFLLPLLALRGRRKAIA